MKQAFSFTEDPVLFLLHTLPSLLPGIQKVIAVFYSTETGSVESQMIRNDEGGYIQESFRVNDTPALFARLRTENSPYTWLRKEDLLFEIKTKAKVQLEIFNEFTNNILLIRIPNHSDGKQDLFFIYFNNDLCNFGTLSPGKILSTDNKTIIAHIVRNSVLTLLKNLNEDKHVAAALHENIRSLIHERNHLKKELDTTQTKYSDGLIRLSETYLADMELNTGKKYRLAESAAVRIREFNGDIGSLMPLIQRSARNAETMNLEGTPGHILISDFHIVADERPDPVKREIVEEPLGDIPPKYIKTVILLDKLENAAILVRSKNKLMTGANIGSEFPRPVTPPAITDALKKHRKKILYLFSEYPGRWELIRSEFRPVQNILNAQRSSEQLSA